MHEEHRTRLRERFMNEGLDGFAPHNVLELLLFYSIPRRDTNETAHRLLDKFGSLSAVFEADIDDLTKVDGIGTNSAVLLKLISQTARRYMTEKQSEKKILDTAKLIAEYLVPRFIGETVERVYLLLLNSSYQILGCELVFTGSVNSSHIQTRDLIERALSLKATMAVLAHNHPGGIAVPSGEDIATTKHIYEAFNIVNVRLIEHFVIAEDKYTPIIIKSLLSLCQFTGDEERRRFYSE